MRRPRIRYVALAITGLICLPPLLGRTATPTQAELFDEFLFGHRDPTPHELDLAHRVAEFRGATFTRPFFITEFSRLDFEQFHARAAHQVLVNLGPRLLTLGLLRPPFSENEFVRSYARIPSGGLRGRTLQVADGQAYRDDVVLHELTHLLRPESALFSPTSMFPAKDSELAALALTEGEATFVQTSLAPGLRNLSYDSVARAFQQEAVSGGSWDILDPPIGRTYLLSIPATYLDAHGSYLAVTRFYFPYVFGREFVRFGYKKGGWPLIDQAFKNPPVTTEQVLHPEKYFVAKEIPKKASFPLDLASDLVGSTAEHFDVGEWMLRYVLATDLPMKEAIQAAAGWDGAAAWIFRKEGAGPTLVLSTLWDTGEDAKEFRAAYLRRFSRWHGVTLQENKSRDSLRIRWDGGTLDIAMEGKRVDIVERNRTTIDHRFFEEGSAGPVP